MKNSLVKFESLNDGLFQEYALADNQLAKVSGGKGITWKVVSTAGGCDCDDLQAVDDRENVGYFSGDSDGDK